MCRKKNLMWPRRGFCSITTSAFRSDKQLRMLLRWTWCSLEELQMLYLRLKILDSTKSILINILNQKSWPSLSSTAQQNLFGKPHISWIIHHPLPQHGILRNQILN